MLHLRLSLILGIALACGVGAQADIWHPGDLTTYGPGNWGGDPAVDAGAAVLTNSFYTVYPTGFLILGSHFDMAFDNPDSIINYEPAVGLPGPLPGAATDPTSTSSGAFGGDVLALALNVDFSDAGLLPGTSGLRFGDLILENLSSTPALNGLTVRQFLADVNIALGGDTPIYDISTLDPITGELNGSFGNGGVSSWAQDHLVAPAAPTAVPEPSSWLALSTVLLGFGWRRRRSRKGAS